MLHASVADFEHVRIVPVTGASEFFESILGESDSDHAVVLVLNIACGAPGISRARSPGPRSFHAPIADAEEYRTPGARDRVTEFRILHFGIEAFGGAPIDLDVIDAPGRVGLNILLFVLIAAGALFASEAAGVGVEAELQSLGVDVIGKRLHSIWETVGVDHDGAVGGAADLPAIVNVDVLIAGVFH